MCLRWRRGRKLRGDVRLNVGYAHHDVLRLDIRVHEVTFVVKVFQTEENLLGDALDYTRRDAFLAVLLDEREEVGAERLEDNAYVGRGGDGVGKRIEKGYDVSSPWMREGGIGDLA